MTEELIKLSELMYEMLNRITSYEEVLVRGNGALVTRRELLTALEKLSEENRETLEQILIFYRPFWIAYKAIKEYANLDTKDYASNNMLLLALTSIIDWLANSRDERRDYTKRFISFLEKNLKRSEINDLINSQKIIDDGERRQLNDLKDFSEYVYKVRSMIVHNAYLLGMHPYAYDSDFFRNPNSSKIHEIPMIEPTQFRKFLWKAILNSLGIDFG